MKEAFIVRIAGVGQYQVPGDEGILAKLNALDNQIVALLQESEAEFRRLLKQMATLVREQGHPLETALVESDLVLPPEDLTLCEAAELFEGDGIIPE